MALEVIYLAESVQIERGPGRGLSQAPLRPGWAENRPKIDAVRSYPLPPNLKLGLPGIEQNGAKRAVSRPRLFPGPP